MKGDITIKRFPQKKGIIVRKEKLSSPFAKAKPIFWLKNGKMTALTKNVRAFAAQFKNYTDKKAAVLAVMNALRDFAFVVVDLQTIKKTYAKRTADEIIRTRKFYVLDPEIAQSLNMHICGCLEYTNTLVAVLRALRIPAKFARLVDHSIAIVYIDGKLYKIELDRSLTPTLTEIKGKLAKFFEAHKNYGTYAEAADSYGLGIRSFDDYHKYSRPKTK